MSIPEKYMPINDSYEIFLFAAKLEVLRIKHKDDKPIAEQSWLQKLLNKADYLSAVPLAFPAYDNIADVLNEIKNPDNLELLGQAVEELLDLKDDDIEAKVEDMIKKFLAFAGSAQKLFSKK